ncbi:hypothetical protein BJH90_13115 [Bacillus halotolerans]|uniref:hypothetical protein n=1 Tax=Bacillus halotolerans TaxID=260554 RepID=UPI000D4E2534|nr:hypothetical protein [Bacillus halotolerans]PON00386.1 hypothetical protein BJH90_13115 [Bacillus halotolerans]
MYVEDDHRREAEEQFEGPSGQFISSLNIKFTISYAQESNLQRAEELTVRTNQLNASGKHTIMRSYIISKVGFSYAFRLRAF